MYALIVDNSVEEYPTSITTLKKRNPGVSFPKSFEDFSYAEYGVVPVTTTDIPTYDSSTHKFGKTTISQVDGVWTESHTIEALSSEEITASNNATALKQRERRNELLAASDWTQLSDSSADTAAWATYRQKLRDLPASSGANWPNNITWPTEPS